MQSDNKGDSLADNLWAEMSLMMVLVVIDTSPCVAIRLVTRTRHFFVVRQCGKLRDALLNSRDPLLPIRIGEKARQCTCLRVASSPRGVSARPIRSDQNVRKRSPLECYPELKTWDDGSWMQKRFLLWLG